jgi:hypothetical protein
MTYEHARDVHHRGLSPVEAANEYLILFAEDPGLAAGFRIGCRRRMSMHAFANFKHFLKLMEGGK